MSPKHYTRSVEKEMQRLAELAQQRSEDLHLKSVSTVINRWKKGSISAHEALTEIRRLTGIKETAWSEGADPGVPVAQAVSDGILRREDLSDEAWFSIEFLVTLAEI